MAKIEVINIRGNKERCVNLSGSVGLGGKNQKSDVMLIQALFYYLYHEKDARIEGLPIPVPTIVIKGNSSPSGILAVKTIQTIMIFQAIHRHRLLNADGVIHPASYEGRVIKDTEKPLMTITYLHLLAKRKELRSGDGDYIKKLIGIMGIYLHYEVANVMLNAK